LRRRRRAGAVAGPREVTGLSLNRAELAPIRGVPGQGIGAVRRGSES
jgi:hypothetical protein